jgi:folate-dependent tRNA-U54 methylase TrmFO/GidA
VTAPPVAPVVVMDDIADQIAKARAATEQAEAAWLQCATELEQLEAVRRARIEALQAEITRLSSV